MSNFKNRVSNNPSRRRLRRVSDGHEEIFDIIRDEGQEGVTEQGTLLDAKFFEDLVNSVETKQGPPGPMGPQGIQGDFRWRGTWQQGATYQFSDVVHFGGSAFVCQGVNVSQAPLTGNGWTLFASKGDKGDKGDRGETGDKGDLSIIKLEVRSDGNLWLMTPNETSPLRLETNPSSPHYGHLFLRV
jgi:hypothetical protein